MTQPEKPDTTGQEPERTSVIATTAKDAPTTAENATTPDDGGAVEANETTPPPWARVTQDQPTPAGFPTTEPDPDVTQALPNPGNGRVYQQPNDEATISVQRPAIANTPLFTDPPPRAAVNLDSSLRTPPGGAGTGPTSARRPGRGPRRANLQIKRVDPWSVLKLSLVLGLCLFLIGLLAVAALYVVLDGMGVWDKINGISSELLNASDNGNSGPLISAGRVFGIAAIIGAINIILFSALSTVGAFIYNFAADLAGGLEVTLAERE
ncbi:DUF3566 domain-containing protein [Actinokineospora inagensis]|uniref:DUF3566 domain-containing protein n=1 Tax=Actinokineospora inagensis TaxID=103730 RepID=UPI000420AC67|nr:DUF3566 domain-containing protein [Actinokineospora inagensis]